MKKIILFALLFLGLQGFAQKRVYIYNFSIKSVKINYVSTIENAGGQFPNIMSTYTTPITIPAGGTYSMETTQPGYKFPYDSTVSTPSIPNWRSKTTASSTSVPLTGTQATMTRGIVYKFDHVGLALSSGSTYKVGNVTYNGIGSGIPVEFVSNSSAGQMAEYVSNLISATETEYLIIITDY